MLFLAYGFGVIRMRRNSCRRRQRRIRTIKVILVFVCSALFIAGGLQYLEKLDSPSGGTRTVQRLNQDSEEDWKLILVNQEHPIPEDYQVELTELSNGEKIDSRIYPGLQEMFDAARAGGLQLFVREGYRTEQEQREIMEEKIVYYQNEGYSEGKARKLAKEYVAEPGTSEHQLGLSVDINADTSVCSADAVYQWLEEHGYQYGFIKRYPENKTKITGINNEPWHYRYVGKAAAQEMKKSGQCLEEYLE